MRAAVPSLLTHVLRTADRHGGCFTVVEAVAAGLTRGEVRTLVSRGTLVRVRDGVLAPAVPVTSPPQLGSLYPDDVLVLSAARLRHPDAVASHETAARIWDLPLLGNAASAPHTLTRPGTRPRTPASAAHGRVLAATLPPGHVVRALPWLPVTSAARTVADLARTRGPEDAVVLADAAARLGLLTRSELLGVLEDCVSFPGIGRAAQILDVLDPRAESPLESLSRWRLSSTGLPAPVTQAVIRDQGGHVVARVDFLFDGCVIGEADGRGKYTGPQDLWAEKRREDALRALGFEVVRWGWDDMWLHPYAVAGQIAAALQRARRTDIRGSVDQQVRLAG